MSTTSVYKYTFFCGEILQSTPNFCYSAITFCKHKSKGENILWIVVHAMFCDRTDFI